MEQAERLKSHARAKKVVHTFAWNPLNKETAVELIVEKNLFAQQFLSINALI